MIHSAASLKARINNYAKDNGISPQVVMQNFFFERFLERLSRSEFKDNFIVKGGLLIASLVGIDTRSTMDLDVTLRKLNLTEDGVRNTLESIMNQAVGDNVVFDFKSIKPIRATDKYGGFCVKFNAKYEHMSIPLSIDISTGDIITPNPVIYCFPTIFGDNVDIVLNGYNIETILAEKVETIISRGIFSTRPRDNYDIYILCKTKSYNISLFLDALVATAQHRGSYAVFENVGGILDSIEYSKNLQEGWVKYQNQFSYAENISYVDTILTLRELLKDYIHVNITKPSPNLNSGDKMNLF